MAMEVIAHSSYIDETDKYDHNIVNDDCDGRTRTAVDALLQAITKFGFIITFLIVYEFLAPMQGLTVKLQGKAEDIVSAYEHVTEVKVHHEILRGDVETEFHRIYEHSVRMASKVGVDPCIPRRSGGISRCRNTTPAPTPETYYRQNVAIPFLDHIQSDLKQQFSGLSSVVKKIQFLVPSVLCSLSTTPDVSELAQFYEQLRSA